MKEQLISIRVVKDNEEEIYFLPSEYVDDFNKMCEYLEEDEDSDLWNIGYKRYQRFSKYQSEGDLSDYELFISPKELKILTGEN